MRFRPGQLVEFDRRPAISERIAGFVIASGVDLVLIHRLDWNVFLLDGYCAIRRRDIRGHQFLNRPGSWQTRALRAKKLKPIRLRNIAVQSWVDLLLAASLIFPLITIHVELKDEELCYIGRLKKLSADALTIFNLDANARWKGARRFKLAEVTRVDFGGGYERALALSAGNIRAVRGEA